MFSRDLSEKDDFVFYLLIQTKSIDDSDTWHVREIEMGFGLSVILSPNNPSHGNTRISIMREKDV